MSKPALASLTALCLAAALKADPIPVGALEVSGNFVYTSLQSDGDDGNIMAFNPALHVYPTSNLFIGPAATLEYRSSGDFSQSQQQLGLEGGFITAIGAASTYLYVGTGAAWTRAAVEVDGDFDDFDDSETGHTLELFGGFKFRIGENFCFNLQPSFSWLTLGDDDANAFNIKMGFSGFLPR